MAWVTLLNDLLCRCLLDFPTEFHACDPLFLECSFSGFLEPGVSWFSSWFPHFLLFATHTASSASYSYFSGSRRSLWFLPSLSSLFSSHFIHSHGFSWPFHMVVPCPQHQIGISKGCWLVYLVVSSAPQTPGSIILHLSSTLMLLPAFWFLWIPFFLLILVGKFEVLTNPSFSSPSVPSPAPLPHSLSVSKDYQTLPLHFGLLEMSTSFQCWMVRQVI